MMLSHTSILFLETQREFQFLDSNLRIDRILMIAALIVLLFSFSFPPSSVCLKLFSFRFLFLFQHSFLFPLFSRTVRVQSVVAMHRIILRAVAKSNKLQGVNLHTRKYVKKCFNSLTILIINQHEKYPHVAQKTTTENISITWNTQYPDYELWKVSQTTELNMWKNLESIRKFSKFTVTKNNSQVLRRPTTAAERVTSFKRTSKFINILMAINFTHKQRSKVAHSLSLQPKCSRWQTERQREACKLC